MSIKQLAPFLYACIKTSKSSANKRCDIMGASLHTLPPQSLLVPQPPPPPIIHDILCGMIKKRYGDSGSPCLRPFVGEKTSVSIENKGHTSHTHLYPSLIKA